MRRVVWQILTKRFRCIYCLRHQRDVVMSRWWRQLATIRRPSISTRLHDATSQKTIIVVLANMMLEEAFIANFPVRSVVLHDWSSLKNDIRSLTLAALEHSPVSSAVVTRSVRRNPTKLDADNGQSQLSYAVARRKMWWVRRRNGREGGFYLKDSRCRTIAQDIKTPPHLTSTPPLAPPKCEQGYYSRFVHHIDSHLHRQFWWWNWTAAH